MSNGLNLVEKRSHNTGDIIQDILLESGVENIEMFYNPENYNVETDWKLFSNISKAATILREAIEDDEMIGILVDDDADGFTSAAAISKFISLTGNGERIKWFFHSEKSHGLGFYSDEDFKKWNDEVDLLIIPDAGSNDFEEQIKLLKLGLKLIILDHHNIDEQKEIDKISFDYNKNYALVNNQLDTNMKVNSMFTGAGVVYKFCQAYDNMFNFGFETYSDSLLDLIALGQIADASDISDPEIRLIVNKGISDLKSEFLKVVLSGEETITPKMLSFSVIPMINAVTRVGTLEEKELLMKALSGYWPKSETTIVTRRRKNKITGKMGNVELEWSMYELADDILKKVKARQNKIVDKVLKNSGDIFASEICILERSEDDIEKRAITGLVANKLASKFSAPTLVLVKQKNAEIWNGSGRGFEKVFKDFRQWCLDTEKFTLAQGHDNAFGVEITTENLDLLKQYLEENKIDVNIQKNIEVVKIYENDSNLDQVREINDNEIIFGGNVKPPMFGYKKLILSRNAINQRGSVVTMFHNGLEFIAYKQEPGVVDDFINTLGFEQHFMVDLVGSPSRNNWSGRIKEQIVLEDFAFVNGKVEIPETPEENWVGKDGELSF